MTLYLKYRPKNLDELDLPEVSESLKKIVASGNIPHAFLFAGPKGTGKTSAARILAKIVNCESKNPPCDKCEQCTSIANGNNLDVIEMDAASHRGIDDVRVLKDAVKLAPVSAKKKIYIIDEAHMLTTEASNALLKTLEEPPPHVLFILATTNPEKLIPTIRSRATTILFRRATDGEIIKSLKRVIVAEKIKIADENLAEIAKNSDGAFRDAIKILEQVSLEGVSFLSKGNILDFEEFVNMLYEKDLEGSLHYIRKFSDGGGSPENLIKQALSKIQKDLLGDISESQGLILLVELLIEANRNISDSPIEELPLEIAVIKWCGGNGKPRLEVGGSKEEIKEEKKEAKEEQKEVAQMVTSSLKDESWKSILLSVKPINASIEALLRAARPVGYDGKVLTLGVYYKFHKERLEDVRNRKLLEDAVSKILNSPTRVDCTLVEPPPKVEPVLTESKDRDIIKVAEEIFGS